MEAEILCGCLNSSLDSAILAGRNGCPTGDLSRRRPAAATSRKEG
jgi:hypothetical protein